MQKTFVFNFTYCILNISELVLLLKCYQVILPKVHLPSFHLPYYTEIPHNCFLVFVGCA